MWGAHLGGRQHPHDIHVSDEQKRLVSVAFLGEDGVDAAALLLLLLVRNFSKIHTFALFVLSLLFCAHLSH